MVLNNPGRGRSPSPSLPCRKAKTKGGFMKWFKCHYCEEIIEGSPHVQVGMMIGFIWHPDRNSMPFMLYDFCELCRDTFLIKYQEGKTESFNRKRKDQYAKKPTPRFREVRRIYGEMPLVQQRGQRRSGMSALWSLIQGGWYAGIREGVQVKTGQGRKTPEKCRN